MKIFSLFILFGAVLLACSPKATKTAATTTPAAPEVSDQQFAAAKTKFPEVTMDQLRLGKEIYYGPCTKCHGAPNIAERSEKKWAHVLDEMAPKAQLSADQKDAVWKYIMAVKLSSK